MTTDAYKTEALPPAPDWAVSRTHPAIPAEWAGEWRAVFDVDTGEGIAIVLTPLGNDDSVGREREHHARALLLAAAPDLFACLRRVVQHFPADAGGASASSDLRRAQRLLERLSWLQGE